MLVLLLQECRKRASLLMLAFRVGRDSRVESGDGPNGTNRGKHHQLIMAQPIGTQSYGFPQTWLGRVAGSVLAVALLVSAFFFLVFFLVAAGVLILGISLRLLWRARQIRARASQDVLEGEYSVEPREKAAEITVKH